MDAHSKLGAWTKGPWKVGRGGDSTPRVYTKHGAVICMFGDGYDETLRTFRNFEANARLVAAAPALVDALLGVMGLVQLTGKDHTKNHRYMTAEKLLAKIRPTTVPNK